MAVSVGFFSGPVVKQLLSATTTFGTSCTRFHPSSTPNAAVGVHADRPAEVDRRARAQLVERSRDVRLDAGLPSS